MRYVEILKAGGPPAVSTGVAPDREENRGTSRVWLCESHAERLLAVLS